MYEELENLYMWAHLGPTRWHQLIAAELIRKLLRKHSVPKDLVRKAALSGCILARLRFWRRGEASVQFYYTLLRYCVRNSLSKTAQVEVAQALRGAWKIKDVSSREDVLFEAGLQNRFDGRCINSLR